MEVFIIVAIIWGIIYLVDKNNENKRDLKVADDKLTKNKKMREALVLMLKERFGKIDVTENINKSLQLTCKIPFVNGNSINNPVRELKLDLKYDSDRVTDTTVVLKLFQLVSNQMVNAGESTMKFSYTSEEKDVSKIPREISWRIDEMRTNANDLQGLDEDLD